MSGNCINIRTGAKHGFPLECHFNQVFDTKLFIDICLFDFLKKEGWRGHYKVTKSLNLSVNDVHHSSKSFIEPK